MAESLIETRTFEQLSPATAVSPDALTAIQEPGGPLVKVPIKQLLGRLVQVDTTTETEAELQTDLDHDDATVGLVFADPDPAKNGWYRKVGASGAGYWSQFEKLSAYAAAEIAEYVAQASTSADAAEASAAAALAAAGVAEAADAAAGLAATAEGQTFWVDNGDGTGTTYRHDPGPIATEIGRFVRNQTAIGAAELLAGGAVAAASNARALAASVKPFTPTATIRSADGHIYKVLPADAADYDLATAGGAKLSVVPLANSVALSAFAADPSGVTGSTDALVKAWNAAPEGGAIVIDGDYLIEKSANLPDRDIDIICRGSLIVDPGSFTGIYIEKLPDFELPGTDLIAPVKGDAKLAWSAGKTPAVNANEYFVVLESTEELIKRIGGGYAAYTKNEIHSISADDWTLFDPILYTYTDLSKLTVRLYKKGRQRDWSSLRVVAAATGSPVSRILLYLEGLSSINLRSMLVDGSAANGAGSGLTMHRCCHIDLDTPRVFGFNAQGVDSYKILNSLSAHITLNRYVSESEPSVGTALSRCYVARHGNQVRFNDCTIVGGDDHFGSNYFLRGGSISRRGFGFAGANFSAVDMDVTNCPTGAFYLRIDTPYCEGTLELDDIRLSADSLLLDNRPLQTQSPDLLITDYKYFDRIKTSNIRVGAGDQPATLAQYFNLRGVPNRAWFTMHTTALIEIDGVQIDAERQTNGQATVMLGNFDFKRMRVSRFGKVASAVAYIGDIRFFTGTQPADMVFEVIDCPAISIDYFGSTNGQKLVLRNVTIDGQGANLSLNPAISSTIEMNNVVFNKAVAVTAPTATYTLDMVNTRFNVLPTTGFSGAASIARGIGSCMAAGLTVPASFQNKMLSYLDATKWKEA